MLAQLPSPVPGQIENWIIPAAALLTKTISSASFNLQLKQDNWDNDVDVNGSSYHAAFALCPAEEALTSLSTRSPL